MIDPSIPLQVKAPEIKSPSQVYGQMLTLKNLVQQADENDLKLKQMRKALDEEEGVSQILQQYPNDLKTGLVKAVEAYGMGAVPHVTKIVQMKQAVQNMDDATRKSSEEKLEKVASALWAIKSEKPEKKAEVYERTLNSLIANGYLRADQVGDGKEIPRTFPGDETLEVMGRAVVSMQNNFVNENKEQALTIAKLKVENTQANFREKMAATNFKNETERKLALARIDNYKSEVQRRTDLTELDKKRLLDETKEWEAKIRVAEQAELGRNKRAANANALKLQIAREGEAGKEKRLTMSRESIERVAKQRGTNAVSVQRAFTAAVNTAKRLNPDWDDLEPEEQDRVIEELTTSFLENTPVAITGKEDDDIITPSERTRSVRPTGPPIPRSGAPAAPAGPNPNAAAPAAPAGPNPNAAAPAAPAGPNPNAAAPVGTKPPKPTAALPAGREYIWTGSKWQSIPKAQIEAYLKANPQASR